MCVIIDSDRVVDLISDREVVALRPLRVAIFSNRAVAVYGGRLAREYRELQRHKRIILELDRRGAFKRIPDNVVDAEEERVLEEDLCRSNDHHIIALARVTNVRLLCSGDVRLHADFKNPKILQPAGQVYQNQGHSALIRKHCAGRG